MKNLSVEYERDFCHWLEQNMALLRAGKFNEIDVDNITEELESSVKILLYISLFTFITHCHRQHFIQK